MRTFRAASADDARFIAQMLVEAADWRPDVEARSVEDLLTVPELAHYARGWPQPGDAGVIAEEDGERIGAAWWRFFSREDPGFGFVDEATPEVSMGVVEGWRRQGVGARMLDELIAKARSAGLPALSLSVETDNFAAHLYERVGFQRVGVVGGSWTMLLQVSAAAGSPAEAGR